MNITQENVDELNEVFAPKVSGLMLLDEASRDETLDFFILFSALASMIGNPGQADYAAANGFMDAYALHRAELVSRGKRQGRTLVMNWPLWREGGLTVHEDIVGIMLANTGMKPMETQNGIEALQVAGGAVYQGW